MRSSSRAISAQPAAGSARRPVSGCSRAEGVISGGRRRSTFACMVGPTHAEKSISRVLSAVGRAPAASFALVGRQGMRAPARHELGSACSADGVRPAPAPPTHRAAALLHSITSTACRVYFCRLDRSFCSGCNSPCAASNTPLAPQRPKRALPPAANRAARRSKPSSPPIRASAGFRDVARAKALNPEELVSAAESSKRSAPARARACSGLAQLPPPVRSTRWRRRGRQSFSTRSRGTPSGPGAKRGRHALPAPHARGAINPRACTTAAIS